MNTTATRYSLKYNRTSVHIGGIEETTKASADGMTYAQSACPVLTRSRNLVTKTGSDNLADALAAAESHARVYNVKVCAHCRNAAERQMEEDRRFAATTPDETIAEIDGNAELVEDATAINITFTGRLVSDGGMVSYIVRANGRMLGSIFGWKGEWSSAYAVDGRHTAMGTLAARMLARDLSA